MSLSNETKNETSIGMDHSLILIERKLWEKSLEIENGGLEIGRRSSVLLVRSVGISRRAGPAPLRP
jgi:hypothetical protein